MLEGLNFQIKKKRSCTSNWVSDPKTEEVLGRPRILPRWSVCPYTLATGNQFNNSSYYLGRWSTHCFDTLCFWAPWGKVVDGKYSRTHRTLSGCIHMNYSLSFWDIELKFCTSPYLPKQLYTWWNRQVFVCKTIWIL